jgi:hypothetical protein
MNRRLAIVLGAATAAVLTGYAFAEEPTPQKDRLAGKKMIEWGWDEPDTKFMRENIENMERFPFDGLIFHALSNDGVNLSWEVWGPTRKFGREEFTQTIDDLKATPFKRFTDRFLRVNITPGNVDWFDDEAWSNVLSNTAVAAHVAKQGNCQGFMFDTEQYDGVTIFDYRLQKDRDSKSFADYQAKVRQRGKEWIEAVNKEFPEITILMTFGAEISVWRAEEANDRSTASYGLIADFIDGMLEGSAAETKLVDAWEFSYPYKERKQFEEAYETITQKWPELSAVPQKYKRHLRAGFGIWMDHKRKGWDTADFSQNHFSPGEFESAVRSALEVSDEYVWIYSERPRWWTNDMLPPAYVEALKKARTPQREQ